MLFSRFTLAMLPLFPTDVSLRPPPLPCVFCGHLEHPARRFDYIIDRFHLDASKMALYQVSGTFRDFYCSKQLFPGPALAYPLILGLSLSNLFHDIANRIPSTRFHCPYLVFAHCHHRHHRHRHHLHHHRKVSSQSRIFGRLIDIIFGISSQCRIWEIQILSTSSFVSTAHPHRRIVTIGHLLFSVFRRTVHFICTLFFFFPFLFMTEDSHDLK